LLITPRIPISVVTKDLVDIRCSSIIRETYHWNISELFFTFKPQIFWNVRWCMFVVGYRYFGLTLRLLMSYIYGAPILDVSRSHTTTQHSR